MFDVFSCNWYRSHFFSRLLSNFLENFKRILKLSIHFVGSSPHHQIQHVRREAVIRSPLAKIKIQKEHQILRHQNQMNISFTCDDSTDGDRMISCLDLAGEEGKWVSFGFAGAGLALVFAALFARTYIFFTSLQNKLELHITIHIQITSSKLLRVRTRISTFKS